MAGPTFWEVHEYANGSPVLAFTAGAGGHAAADEFGTTFYVDTEFGWRDGAGMYDTASERLLDDGSWAGPQYKQSFLVTISGYWVATSQEGAFSSIRLARNALGRRWRTGRLLAQDSDGKRLYADVVRGGPPLMTPVTPVVGNWSMSFKVDDPTYYSEQMHSTEVRPITNDLVGMGFDVGFPMAFQTSSVPPGSRTVINGGDVPAPFVATLRGPLSGFALIDSATGRTLKSSIVLGSNDTAVLDSSKKTFRVGGANARSTVTGEWFGISPGSPGIVFVPTASFDENTQCTITAPAEAWGA